MAARVALFGSAMVLLAAAALILLSGPVEAQCASGPPANDCFANAITIGPSPFSTPATSTVGATNEPGEPAPCGGIGATIWYSWTPTVAGTAQVDTYGSGWDTVVAAYTGSSVSGLTNVNCNDDNPFPESMFTFTCVAGTTYMIQAGGFGGGTGNIIVNISGCTNVAACLPMTQTVAPGTASFTAGGSGPFTWSAPGGTPNSGSGAAFATNYGVPGVYTVTVTNSFGSSNCTVNVVVPGCGYTIDTTIPYDFIDISATGTGLPHGDDTWISTPLPPGFTFTLCGTSATDITTSSNGYICVGVNGNCATYPGQPLPTFGGGPGGAVFGYWADLYPPGCPITCTLWEVQGTAPNRVYIYMEKDVDHFSGGGPVSYEIKLFEDTNCVEVHYLDVSDPFGVGSTAAGYEDATGGVGYQYAYQAYPGFSAQKTAWSACPIPPFRAEDDAYIFNEDQPAQSFDVFLNDIDGPGLPYSVTSFTAPAMGNLTGPVGTAFTYTPDLDATGTDSFNYTLTNSAGRNTTATVTLTINPVNDRPSFTRSGGLIVTSPLEGEHIAPGWATGVVPGPATALDEAGQAIGFVVVSNTNPDIFSGVPTLERTLFASATAPAVPATAGWYGMLRFSPSGVGGISTVCFRARDDAGNVTVTNGFDPPLSAIGIDISTPQCVDIRENSPPVAYYEPSSSGAAPGQGVTFDPCPRAVPQCSFDPDGTSVSYAWDFGDGYTSDLGWPVHVFAMPGMYQVVLTVTDDWGGTASFLRTITVAWKEDPGVAQEDAGGGGAMAPLADAGDNRTVDEGTLVQLSGSQKGGTETATFQWTQVHGVPVELAFATSPYPEFTAPRLPGSVPVDLMFSLKVSDGDATSRPDYVVVRVVSDNQLPMAEAGDTVLAEEGDVVPLDGSRSGDPDGDTLTFQWVQVAGPLVELTDAETETASFTAPASTDVLRFQLRVWDGRAAAFDEVMVVLNPVEGAMPEASREEVAAPAVAQATASGIAWPALLGILAVVLATIGLAFFIVRRQG